MQRSLFLVAALSLMTSACGGMARPDGKPVAQMDYGYVSPYVLGVNLVDVQQIYDPAANPDDVSTTLPLPAHTALLEYANNRFKAAQGTDTFRLVLEDATVTKKLLKQDNQTLRWLGVGQEEEFRFQISMGVYRIPPGSFSGPGSVFKMDRTLVIPEKYSLAQREEAQVEFVNTIVNDMDAKIRVALETMQVLQ